MALTKGTRLGPYEIVSALGAGGMGEVYRGRDTRLDRLVAVKVLGEKVVGQPEWRQRFEREARIIAGFNHPNICQIFDVGREQDIEYLVMEFVEGETLWHRLKRGPLPLDQAIRYAIQIAEALDCAHRRGVVHRDLTPGNVMLTKAGVKVLDFGLAIATGRDQAPASEDVSTLPTEPLTLTNPGLVVGTLPYISPERLRGNQADARSDIFSFGALLYEMLTGHKAFAAKSQADLIVAVIEHQPPPVTTSQPGIPPAVERIIRRCLVKDPEERWQSARDLAEELRWIAGDGAHVTAVPATPARRRAWPYFVAAAAVVAAFAAGFVWQGSRSRPAPSWSGAMLGGPAVALGPRVSPDGKMLALQAMVNGLTQVAVMKPDSGNWLVLTRDRRRGQVMEIAWSPDGGRLYFDRNADVPRGIYSVSVLGGDERPVLDDAAFPEVLADRSLLVAKINSQRKLQPYRFWPDTGRLQAFPVELQSISGAPMRVFPDGKEAVFLGRPTEGAPPEPHLYALDLSSGRTRRLAPQLTIPIVNNLFPLAVSPDGQWVLINLPAGNLHRIVAVPRDGSNAVRTLLTLSLIPWYLDVAVDGSLYLEQIDQPCEVLRFPVHGGTPERLAASPAFRFGSIAEFAGGTVVVPAILAGRSRIMKAAPGAEPAPLIDSEDETAAPLSRVGENDVAFLAGTAAERVIAIANVADGRIVRRLRIPHPAVESLAASPDGRTLYYAAAAAIWSLPAEGGEPRRIAVGDGVIAAPDGRELIVKLNEKDGSRLVRIPAAGGEPRPIPFGGDLRLTSTAPGATAIAGDGRILVQVASADSWFWHAAVLDAVSGRTTAIPVNYEGDLFFPGWDRQGRVLALGIGIKGSIWRFRPEGPDQGSSSLSR
jgi:hypothetical protein